MENTKAVTRRVGIRTIKELIGSDQFKQQVAMALPKHCTPDRFIRVALTAMMRTPKLMECTQESLFSCLLSLSQMGLEPDGRRAHLIPYRDNKQGTTVCTLIVDYKGLAELVMRSGEVSYLHADVVCDNDEFDCNLGQITTHRVNYKSSRGRVYAAYSIAKMKDGNSKCEVMTRDEVESIRSRSRAGQSGPWVTDWNEMAKKTVFRRLSKWLPLSPELRDKIEADDELPALSGKVEIPVASGKDFICLPEPEAEEEPKKVEPIKESKPAEDDVPMDDSPPKDTTQEPKPENVSPQIQLSGLMNEAGVPFDDFVSYLKTTNICKDADSIPEWDLVPDAVCDAMLVENAKLSKKVIRIYGRKS